MIAQSKQRYAGLNRNFGFVKWCALFVLLLAFASEGLALESIRGMLRKNNDPSCLSGCDKYYVEPDHGYIFMFIKGSLDFYVDLHVEITGFRINCNGCFTLLAQPNVVILPLTSVDEEAEQPLKTSLAQNYPNPFNPSTLIRYTIAEESFVSLKVYTLIGEELESLVERYEQPGRYSINWHAAERPTGIYFYKLSVHGEHAPPMVRTRTMILAR